MTKTLSLKNKMMALGLATLVAFSTATVEAKTNRTTTGALIGAGVGLLSGNGLKGVVTGAALGAGTGALTEKGNKGKNARKGAGIGAAVGAAAGLLTGDGLEGALKGAAVGGAGGAIIGRVR